MLDVRKIFGQSKFWDHVIHRLCHTANMMCPDQQFRVNHIHEFGSISDHHFKGKNTYVRPYNEMHLDYFYKFSVDNLLFCNQTDNLNVSWTVSTNDNNPHTCFPFVDEDNPRIPSISITLPDMAVATDNRLSRFNRMTLNNARFIRYGTRWELRSADTVCYYWDYERDKKDNTTDMLRFRSIMLQDAKQTNLSEIGFKMYSLYGYRPNGLSFSIDLSSAVVREIANTYQIFSMGEIYTSKEDELPFLLDVIQPYGTLYNW